MSTQRRHMKIPFGLATALQWNTKAVKVSALFLVLKHMDASGSGALPATNKTYREAAGRMRRSERTILYHLDSLEAVGLIRRVDGILYMASYDALCAHVGVRTYAKGKQNHHFNKRKLPKNVPFEYVLRVYEEKESQERQKASIRKKLKHYYERLTLAHQEAMQLERQDFQGLVQQFLSGQEYSSACDPDTARSHMTRAVAMCQKSPSGPQYWQNRLEKLRLITVERNRLIVSPQRKNLERHSRLGSVFYSRAVKATVLQLPNSVTPLI